MVGGCFWGWWVGVRGVRHRVDKPHKDNQDKNRSHVGKGLPPLLFMTKIYILTIKPYHYYWIFIGYNLNKSIDIVYLSAQWSSSRSTLLILLQKLVCTLSFVTVMIMVSALLLLLPLLLRIVIVAAVIFPTTFLPNDFQPAITMHSLFIPDGQSLTYHTALYPITLPLAPSIKPHVWSVSW